MKNLKRVSQSPLIEYTNFKDGSYVNLIRLSKPYADGRAWAVVETTKSIFCSDGMFTTEEEARTKYKLMVRNGSVESLILKQGITGN